MIPCKECIAFAICKHRVVITCSPLTDYAHYLFNKRIRARHMWEIINETLPKMRVITNGQRGYQKTFPRKTESTGPR